MRPVLHFMKKSLTFNVLTDDGMNKRIGLRLLSLFFFTNTLVYSQNDSISGLFNMSFEELMNQEVSIATKSPVTVKQAPSIVSIITKEEIELSTARNLKELLMQIPGFEFTARVNGFEGVGFRGVMDFRSSSRFLLLQDGKPMNEVFTDMSFGMSYSSVDIYAIERIEIIRGPGSALFGKNAFLSVINIVTKNASQDERVSTRVEYGSFNAYRAIVSAGKHWDAKKQLKVTLNHIHSDITDTEGADDYGRLFPWSEGSQQSSLLLNSTLGNFQLHLSGMLFRFNSSLYDTYADRGSLHYSLLYKKSLSEKLNITTRFYGQYQKNTEHHEYIRANDDFEIIPATDTTSAVQLKDIYPDGVYYSPYYSEYLTGLDIMSELLFSERNQLLTGIQVSAYGVYALEILSNLNLRTGDYYPGYTRYNLPLDSLGWFEDGEHHYASMGIYAQDIWYPIEKLGITIGARLDMNSEIGPVLNPRVGITYMFNQCYSAKLLYGQAFKAPSPSEQYKTLGFAFGNPDLESEYIKTIDFEIAQSFEKISNRINVFYNIIDNMIYAETVVSVDPSNRYYNLGTNRSMGFELESKQRITTWIYSYLNYSYNKSVNRKTIDGIVDEFDHYDISPHKINAGITLNLPYNFILSSDLRYRSERFKFQRTNPATGEKEDVSQDPVGNYTIINSKLTYRNENYPLEFYFAGYNILNTVYYSQDNERAHYPQMPGTHFLAGCVFKY